MLRRGNGVADPEQLVRTFIVSPNTLWPPFDQRAVVDRAKVGGFWLEFEVQIRIDGGAEIDDHRVNVTSRRWGE